MKRVKFTLSMPNRGSWNGGWSGSERHYYRQFRMSDKAVRNILGDKETANFGYNFGDGWYANVGVSIIPVGTRLPKSDGFCGYDWMISSIKCYGEIRAH